jgi:hypothetical protein
MSSKGNGTSKPSVTVLHSGASSTVYYGVVPNIPLPETEVINIFQYNNGVNDETYNINPVGQRLSTDNASHDKARGIIESIFDGSDIGEISYRVYNRVNKLTGRIMIVFEIIDGSHRSRAINDFISGKFKLSAKSKIVVTLESGERIPIAGLGYKDLPQELKNYFNFYNLRLCKYPNANAKQAAKLFQNKNMATLVNHQAMLNSNSENLVAIFVRETAREIPGHEPQYPVHSLFSSRIVGKGSQQGELKPRYLSYVNKDLKYDEFIAIQFIYALNNGLGGASWEDLEDLYTVYGDEDAGIFVHDKKLLSRSTERVIECLNFLLRIGEAYISKVSEKGLSLERVVMAARYYWWLKSQNKEFKLQDPLTFIKVLSGALNDLVGKPGKNSQPPASKWINKFVDAQKFNLPKGEPIPVCSKMREWMQGYNADGERAIQTVLWLHEAMEDYCKKHNFTTNGLTFKDNVRGFSFALREAALARQGFRCWVTGEPLSLDEADAGHIVAHTDGGPTTLENCAMIRKDLNKAMGSSNAREWREMWRRGNGLDPATPPAGEETK